MSLERRTDPFRLQQGPRLGLRIARAVVLCAGAALLVAALIFNVFAYRSMRAALVDEMTVQARMVAGSGSAALVFRDEASAAELLASLQASPVVVHAELLDAAGAPLASYRRGGTTLSAGELERLRQDDGSDDVRFDADRLRVRAPVLERERRIGSVLVVASLHPLHQRAAAFVGITALAMALAFAVAYLLVIRLRREVEATEARLDELAYFDAVTGLRNRHAANDTIQRLIASEASGFALLLLDLDDFKTVNDTFGHGVGDELLRTVATLLTQGVQPLDLLFRFGGDEFVLIAPRVSRHEELVALAEKVLNALAVPISIQGHELQVRCSVGIAGHGLGELRGAGAVRLIRAADTAMYVAKGLGKNTYAVYDPEMERDTQHRLRLESDLRRAVERGELRLHYQPIHELEGGRLIGAEALLRWQHPELGMVPPLQFIPAAEANGLIVDIGGWVLNEACRQIAAWSAAGHGDIRVAVNVSARQIRRGLMDQVHLALAASGADPSQLELEITEHSMVEDIESNVRQLSLARALGVQVAVDDFGTGLSSLAYLKRLPIGKLKIDRAFVKDLPGDADDAAIAVAILTMARGLGLDVVAEGVETAQQRDFLRGHGCRYAQGYLYSRPLEPAAMEALLSQRSAPRLSPQAAGGG